MQHNTNTQYDTVQYKYKHNPINDCTMHYNGTQYHTLQHSIIQVYTVPCNTRQWTYNTVQYNTTRLQYHQITHAVQYNTRQDNTKTPQHNDNTIHIECR